MRHRVRVGHDQAGHLGGEQARGGVGPLEVRAELEELVRLAARERRLREPLEGVRAVADTDEEVVRRGEHGLGPQARDAQVEPVQVLPHLARDLLAHAARVLARARDARRDGVRVAGCQSMNSVTDGRRVLGEVLAEQLVEAEQAGSARATARLRSPQLGVEQPVEVHVAGGGSCPRPARCSGPSSRATLRRGSASGAQHPGVLAAAALRGVDDERALAQRGARQPARARRS